MFQVPLNALVVMVGPSGAGKSTFVKNYFKPHEVISSDNIRQELTGDFRNQHANDLVFNEFHRRIETKLSIGERVVADATHLRKKDRMLTASLGARYHVPVFYVVVNRSLEDKLATGGWRLEVPRLIQKHEETFRGQEKDILAGDSKATVIDTRVSTDDGAEMIEVVEKFDFDNLAKGLKSRGYKEIEIIGDVHGMIEDFQKVAENAIANNRMIVQLGDIVDYGHDSASCIEYMHRLVMYGQAIFIIGNHERKFEKYIIQNRKGDLKVKVKGGLVATVEQLQGFGTAKREMIENKFLALMNYARHHVVIGDRLFVHAGASDAMWTLTTNRLVGFDENRAVYGEIDGFREDGYPNRIYNWVDEIPEGKTVFVGHDIRDMEKLLVQEGRKGGKAIFVDTGSGKGGKLSSIIRSI